MAYIGKEPQIGNYQTCDAISVVNGQAAYTMQVSSVNVVPESVNHMIVSLNGVLQKPGSSFTISGSTITFASNLATGDVIDFILLLGNVLDLGTPSDNTVATAKIVANAVTAAKFNADVISGQTALATAPADTDEFLISDAGVLKRIDYSLIKGGGMFEFISSTDVTSDASQVDFTSFSTDYSDFKLVIQNLHGSSDGVETYMRFFGSDGNIKSGGSDYSWTFGYSSGDGQADNDSNIRLGRPVGNAGHESSHYEITIFDVHDTGEATATEGYKHAMFQQSASLNDGTIVYAIGGGWGKAEVSNNYSITGVRIYLQAGNIASGRFSLYGRKHS